MASEQLSQSDIDALLGGGGAAAAPRIEPAAAQAPAELYDFRRPRHVSKERLRTLEAMYERLVKSLEAWLIGRVRKQVELRLQSVEQFSFGEFTLSLPTPCASFGFDILNIEGQQGVIDIGHEFAYLLVDRFFGGGGQPASMHRALTPIERLAVRTVVERIGVLLAERGRTTSNSSLKSRPSSRSRTWSRGNGPLDPVLVANIEVAIGDEILHASALPPARRPRQVLLVGRAAAHPRNRTGSEPERQATRRLTETALTPRTPMSRRACRHSSCRCATCSACAGQRATTGLALDTPLELHIGGQQRFTASAGRLGSTMAVRLLDGPLPASASVSAAR